MKQKVHPGVVIAAIVILLVYVGTMFFKAAADKPAYAGQDAGHPSAMSQGAGGGGEMKKPATSEDARKMGIPGSPTPAAKTEPSGQ